MSAALEAFGARVLADGSLQARLRAEPDRPRFAALVVALAAGEGVAVTTEEVEAALVAARRHHRERWV